MPKFARSLQIVFNLKDLWKIEFIVQESGWESGVWYVLLLDPSFHYLMVIFMKLFLELHKFERDGWLVV